MDMGVSKTVITLLTLGSVAMWKKRVIGPTGPLIEPFVTVKTGGLAVAVAPLIGDTKIGVPSRRGCEAVLNAAPSDQDPMTCSSVPWPIA